MTLLFVPGFMADRSLWDDVVAALQPKEPVAFVDLEHGDSIEDMARRALDGAPDDFELVGFSMGAMWLARWRGWRTHG